MGVGGVGGLRKVEREREPGEGWRVVLGSWRRADLAFLRRVLALRFCWEWSKLGEEWVWLVVGPVLCCRIRVDVCGCVMVGVGGGLSGKVMAVVGVAVAMWLGPEDCAQLLWRSAQRVPSLLRGSAGLRPGLWRKEQVGVGEQVGGLRAQVNEVTVN